LASVHWHARIGTRARTSGVGTGMTGCTYAGYASRSYCPAGKTISIIDQIGAFAIQSIFETLQPCPHQESFFQQQNLFQHRFLFLVIRIPLNGRIIHLQNRPETDLPHPCLLAVWPVIDLASQIDCVDRVHHHPQQTSTYQGNPSQHTHPKLSRNQHRSAPPLAREHSTRIGRPAPTKHCGEL
jgi:hypothetical protein